MTHNKDKGTSVGFTENIDYQLEIEKLDEAFKKYVESKRVAVNKVCKEHDWVEFPSVCCKCGSQKPIRDFKIKENIEVIENEFLKWLDEECPPGTMTYDLSHDFAENLRNRLDELLPDKKYLEIKKKNT